MNKIIFSILCVGMLSACGNRLNADQISKMNEEQIKQVTPNEIGKMTPGELDVFHARQSYFVSEQQRILKENARKLPYD